MSKISFKKIFLLTEDINEIEKEYGGDWESWLYDNDYDIPEETLRNIAQKYNVAWRYVDKNKKFLEFGSYYLVPDRETKTAEIFCKVTDILDKINELSSDDVLDYMNITEDDVYMGGWECTIGDFKEYGGTVYHYTNKDGILGIKKSKHIIGSFGTGINNRGAFGIFTSIDPEEYADGMYGDYMVTIDLAAFKEGEGLPKLDIEPEPDVLENELKNSFAQIFGVEYNGESSDNNSHFTVIVRHEIPIKYLTIQEE